MSEIAGRGSLKRPLSSDEIREICMQGLAPHSLAGKNVLVVIPDHTRHARIGDFFRLIHELIGADVRTLDVLVATGTHADMELSRIYRHLNITEQEHRTQFPGVRFFNHEHDNPRAIRSIGTISGKEIARLTDGLYDQAIDITINRKVLEYDHVILVTPVVPHESMGFAGGNKYFFPGVAGLEVVETFHWVAALLTNWAVNGVKDTPTRRIIDRASELIPTPRTCLAFAVNDRDEPQCLFVGDPKEAWSRAADYSARLHIARVDQPFREVLAITPDIYEELWVGGKAMYKLEPIIADEGEIIIYGPQIRSISFVHEEAIRRVGYHVVEYFTSQWDRFAGESKLILAHSTNVRGLGTFRRGREFPRIRVTLATSIPEEVCRSVNLGYRDYRSVDPAAWRTKRGSGTMVVENAGQMLYRLNEN